VTVVSRLFAVSTTISRLLCQVPSPVPTNLLENYLDLPGLSQHSI